MTQARKPKIKKTSRKDSANIVKAIGLSKILTAYEEANLPLPQKLLGQCREAVGLSPRRLQSGSLAERRRLARIQKTPFRDRHRLFYDFWEEFFDFKMEPMDFYDESPDWLQRVADEINNEIEWDL